MNRHTLESALAYTLLICGCLLLAQSPSLADSGASASKCLSPVGDLTADGVTDVMDVQCTVLCALYELDPSASDLPACTDSVDAADVNCDDSVTVTDAVTVIRLALELNLDAIVDADQDGCPNACETMTLQAFAWTPCGDTSLTGGGTTASVVCAGWLSAQPIGDTATTFESGVAP